MSVMPKFAAVKDFRETMRKYLNFRIKIQHTTGSESMFVLRETSEGLARPRVK